MRTSICLFILLLFHFIVQGQTITASGPTSICEGTTVVLTLNSPPPGSIRWKKDGAVIGGAAAASYAASAAGSYTVTVADTLNYGPVVVRVLTYPKAGFTFTPSNQCSNTPVRFTNTSTGTGLTYSWNFGDPKSENQNSSTTTHPLHTFIGTPGNGTQNFSVKLIADNAGCKDSLTQTVTTKQVPDVKLGGTGFTTYNGLPYFTQCTSIPSDFTFTNQSSTSTTNTAYRIKWGDNTPDFTASTFTAITHNYPIGNFKLEFIVTGQNGCADTGVYNVFVGNNPAVGLNNPGNTFICSQSSLTFPISGTGNNPPGTIYNVFFNDGTAAKEYNHPAPASVTHLFEKGSCGIGSQGFPNSFQASIQASNPCGTSAASVVPIYVSEKTKAVIGFSPDTVICVSNSLTLTNLSGNGFGVSSNGVCTPGKGIWSVSQASGWTLTGGSLGNDFGFTDPSLWTEGSNAITLRFTQPGEYFVKLRTSATQACGGEEATIRICVNPAPVAAFSVNSNVGCAPFKVTTTNNSNSPLCKTNTYQWSVSYSNTSGCTPNESSYRFLNNTSAYSATPEFEFQNPGVYTISLVTKNSDSLCVSAPVMQTITVKSKPQATVTAPTSVCQNGTINPSAVVNNCYATTPATHAWTFAGGMPATSTESSPGSISYNTPGTYTITLAVTNECGTTTVTRNITVNPAPDVAVPADKTFCAGEESGAILFTGSVTGTSFAWTNSNPLIGLPASGTGNLPPFVATNNTNAPITATITVTPTSGCAGPSQAFTVRVNPRPGKPVVMRPVVYCLNEPASPLSATPATGNSLHWYTGFPLANPAATAPTPSTSSPGTTTFYVTQSNSFSCPSDTVRIDVVVHPRIGNNTITADQTICSGNSAQPLLSSATPIGGSGAYSYQWQQSTNGGTTWTDISNATATSFDPGAVTVDTRYRRIVSSSNCRDTSNAVTILVLGSLTNNTISAAQTICAGTRPETLVGNVPTGGNGTFAYQWQSAASGGSWEDITGETGADYRPPVLLTTTSYRRRVVSGECTVFSAPVQITVNPKPVMAAVQDKLYCNTTTTGAVTFSSTPAAVYTWTNNNTAIGLAATGTGNIPSFTAVNNSQPKAPQTATISVIPSFTGDGVSCAGDATRFSITVLPTITIAPVPDTTVCTGQTMAVFKPVPDTAFNENVGITYHWSVSGSGLLLASGNGAQIPAYATANEGTTDLVSTITITPRYSFAGHTCEGTPRSYNVTVKPSTANASAGPNQVLCAQSTATLSATFVSGTTGIWSQVGSNVSITDTSATLTTATGLLPGSTYTFVWTQTGFASCPATTDTVIIDNKAALVNRINTTAPTICAGTQLTVEGYPATGGGGVYTFQWQQSTDGINFTNISGGNDQNISFTPTTTVWLRRLVDAAPCSSYSDTVKITVQPALTNNTISANATICIGQSAPAISGSLPTGGNNSFTYAWQQSTDGGASWTNITGASGSSFSPGLITITTMFRRLVSTDLCSGPFGSTSNAVTIIVNPDAKASFAPAVTVQCPPFHLTPSVINLQPSAANGTYQWFADDVLLGTGTLFPGYSLTTENDSVTIKLKVLSAFGCKNDSLSVQFKTPKTPSPSFTLSDTVGCGPLTVTATNTSSYINEFSYLWDFGNGITSTAVQPPAVTFAQNPAFGDTVYTVKLLVFSPCDTLSFTRFVRVKSLPKALFTPAKTVGCSPMTVTFRNNSRGNNNTYYWDFGDGTTFSTTSADSVQHTFITGRVDTFFVRLRVTNECGEDSARYAIVVSPNTVKLNVAVNGTEHFGCTPHTVAFINNTSGAGTFQWNFGDGNILSTTKNIDTVYHTYQSPGRFAVQIRAFNTCSDTTATETIVVYPKPKAAFITDKNTVCIGDSIRFTNQSDSATSYRWNFGDGRTSTVVHPTHRYTAPGLYTVRLVIYRNNPSGNVCIDSVHQQVQVSASLTGTFTASDITAACAPFTATFVNGNKPSVTATWDFGDGTTGSGDSIAHTYSVFGTYTVLLTTTVPGGCTYNSSKTITVNGPGGSLRYTGGFTCLPNTVQLQAVASNTDTYVWDFGDGTTQTSTQQSVFHRYSNPGSYVPSVKLQNAAGCVFPLKGVDTIKVDRIQAGFRTAQQAVCGATTLQFTDTSHVFFGKTAVHWNFGDGTSGTGASVAHVYTASGTYPVQMIVYSNSGCADTVHKQLTVQVNNKPAVSITAAREACTGKAVLFSGNTHSIDAITLRQWTVSNGVTATGTSFTYLFQDAGTYTVRFIAGTVNGCYDTTTHTIVVNPSPQITAGTGGNLCRGNTLPLTVSGAATYQWTPLQGLSCYTCPNPVASPVVTTPYVVEGKNSFGCSDYDTVVVTVIQPLKMTVSANDSICIGQSSNLLVSGGTNYSWSPATGLSNTTSSNPVASPQLTTTYRVVGNDGFNCFTDTAFITVAVGQYPTVSLGPDLSLAAGTQHPLVTSITNGPIRTWEWSPTTNLSCIGCPLPVAEIKKDITYAVKVTTAYGCSASDTVAIRVFCEASQVFIPNAFTPDGDGINDILMVRSKGVLTVKFFRIFNRWGEVVFEKSNFAPNNPLYAWDGKIKGILGGPDVFVYTCEVMCENGTSFTYKGNVSIIK